MSRIRLNPISSISRLRSRLFHHHYHHHSRFFFSSLVENDTTKKLGTLRVVGKDNYGIVAACTQILGQYECNIVKSEQWTDTSKNNMFYQRLEFHYPNGVNKQECENEIAQRLALTTTTTTTNTSSEQEQHYDASDPSISMIQNYPLQSIWNWRDRKQRVGIMVSKYDHCLWELLLRYSAHQLTNVDIDCVISNHDTLQHVADTFHIPYHVLPITTQNKIQQEQKQIQLLKNCDIVVLARYMQVLTPNFLQHFPNRIINIHHSFLPAFSGGSPYRQAYDRGVKLIGATAHYVTEELDDGPIIEQDVMNVSHRDSLTTLIKKGRILERNVLFKALEAHLNDRIIVHQNKCVVFND